MSILSTHNLTVGYRKGKSETVIMSDLNLEFKRGSLVALVGANGIGKSTLLRSIVGNQLPLAGHIMLADTDLSKLSKQEQSRLLAIVNTDRTQAGGLTVRELVSLGRQPYTGFLGILDRNDKQIVEESMQSAGIAHKSNSYLAELSDGERQKVMIAKALAQKTPVIILDEPTAFLDVESRMETMLLLHRLAHEQDKAILLSSHDLSQSIMLADELWLITNERKLLSGNTEDLALSGAMDNIFSSENIKFDLIQGDFCLNIECKHKVNLTCNDDLCRRWITNALKRNSIGIDDKNESEITINATSPYSIEIRQHSQSVSAHNTFADLLHHLRNLLSD